MMEKIVMGTWITEKKQRGGLNAAPVTFKITLVVKIPTV